MLTNGFKGFANTIIVKELINRFRQIWAQNSRKIVKNRSNKVNNIHGVPNIIQGVPKSQYWNDLEGFKKWP